MRSFSNKLTLFVSVILAVVLGTGVAVISAIMLRAGDVDLESASLDRTTFIYAVDPDTGDKVEYDRLYDDENRVWVSYDQIPKNMINAFVAIEDERFYKHHGFDIKRLIGAATTFMAKGNSSYGASTITQQLVKNISGDNDVKVTRKIREIYRAVRLEQKYSKEQILEYYLNTIFLSRQCNGVQAAAKRYFDKDVSELTLAETASIAGITQYPSKFDPISHPENNKEKQLLVLSKMLELKYINQEEYDEAVNEKLVFCEDDSYSNLAKTQMQFSDAVINEVSSDLQEKLGMTEQEALKMIYTSGLTINASVNPKIQSAIEEVYADDSNFPGGSEIMQSAMVVIDPKTGYIVGMSGGRDKSGGRMGLNRAMQTLRQPGSSIKPLSVYTPAVEYGIVKPSDRVVDEPLKIGSWQPKNSNNRFVGTTTIADAVTWSRNIPAIKTLQSLTVEKSYDFLVNRFHITSLVEKRESDGKTFSDKDFAPLALGGLTDGVSVVEMASAYSAIADGGVYRKPTTYIDVVDSTGKVLLEGKDKEQRIMMPDTAYTMTSMLQNVVTRGTGTGAALSKMPVAGKTGTTDDDKDRWFVGFTPYYTAAVWSGYDTPKPLSGISYNPSAAVWKKVMSKIHENLESKNFEKPDEDENVVKICKVSHKRATDLCALDIRGSQIEYEEFENSEPPEEKCTDHKEYFLCYESELRAKSGCKKRRVSALGVADENHTESDGYITNKYCTIFHGTKKTKENKEYKTAYKVCTESGLLATENCPSTRTVTKSGSKPSEKCDIHRSASSTSSPASTSTPHITATKPPAPRATSPIGELVPDDE